MCKIKVREFGPIKAGLGEQEGFLDIPKATVFIGNQGSGKSTVAKLFSTCSWLEKALFRGDLRLQDIDGQPNKFIKHCQYQNIHNYFRETSEVHYIGKAYSIHYTQGQLTVEEQPEIREYKMPKLMYVPAERNFLSAVAHPERLKGLPLPLYTFLEEFDRAREAHDPHIALPIEDISFAHQKLNKLSFIVGDGYKLRLTEASSGLQSAIPLALVSRYLANRNGVAAYAYSHDEESLEWRTRLRKQVRDIMENPKLSEEVKAAMLERIGEKLGNDCFINIVEEIEQNLYPQSQKGILYEMLVWANVTFGNKLVLTTHSPYIVNYLSLAIKAHSILQRLSEKQLYSEALSDVVALGACILGKDVAIYEMGIDGTIQRLPQFHGIPSDANFLNQSLAETNADFDKLLEIEDQL